MASANGRHGSREPLGGTDEELILTSDSRPRTGGIPVPDNTVAGELPVSGLAGGESVDPNDAGVESGSAYDTVKVSMKQVRQPYGLPDDPMRLRFKKLLAFLTDRELPGGKRRGCPKVAFEATKGGWKASITCNTLSMKYVVEFRYIADLFAALSTGFTSPGATWIETEYGEAAKDRKEEERKRLAAQGDETYNLAKGGRKDPSDVKGR